MYVTLAGHEIAVVDDAFAIVNVVLADEINRTGPKVQAAFLECMAEKQVTMDNVTRPLDQLFFVLGTQNPLDIAGTYPLPQVQLDRFLFKVPMGYVDAATESAILGGHAEIREGSVSIEPICSRSDILDARIACESVHVQPSLRDAIVGVVQATRNNPMIQFGASTRAALMLQSAVRAWALDSKLRRSSNSHSSVAKKLSAMALS